MGNSGFRICLLIAFLAVHQFAYKGSVKEEDVGMILMPVYMWLP